MRTIRGDLWPSLKSTEGWLGFKTKTTCDAYEL